MDCFSHNVAESVTEAVFIAERGIGQQEIGAEVDGLGMLTGTRAAEYMSAVSEMMLFLSVTVRPSRKRRCGTGSMSDLEAVLDMKTYRDAGEV